MTDTALPDGLLTMIKTATRALIAACAVPGTSGPERVEQITGYSRGQISKWGSDSFPVIMPPEVIFLLEFTVQKPIFAGVLATLTGNRVEPIASDDGVTAQTLMGEVVGLAGSHSRFMTSLTDGLADLKVTPAEAKRALKDGITHQDQLNGMLKRLSAIAEGKRAREEW